jgi:GTPase
MGIIGNVDAGKSTLVAVLTKGMPDDGNGGARTRIFNYKHEQ